MSTNLERLRITEIFYSLQGETATVGIPTVFIRLTGCPLRCQYCDTAYAFHGGKYMGVEDILNEVKKYATTHVTVSGGEPLAQRAVYLLLKELCNLDYIVSLETSGAISVELVDERVVKIIDVKTPGSLEESKNYWENFSYLTAQDQIKFVICHREDYEWSKRIITQYKLPSAQILFSPSYKQLAAKDLADWIIQDQLPVRFQLQLHKVLWGDVAGK